jgi:hypothetical protein
MQHVLLSTEAATPGVTARVGDIMEPGVEPSSPE